MPQSDPKKPQPAGADGLVEFSAGEYIVREGEAGDEMYIVEKGQVELLQGAEGEELRIQVLKRGDFFGEECVVGRLPRVVSARAVSACRLLPIDESALREMLEQGADVGLRLLLGLSRRLRESLRLVPAASTPARPLATMKVATRPAQEKTVPVTAGRPKLVHLLSGKEIEVPDRDEVKIGRYDAVTGANADIDLSSYDSEQSLSRFHAQILRRDGKLLLGDEVGSSNGTFVNDRRVAKGSPVEIHDGDELRFGLIKTRFHAAD